MKNKISLGLIVGVLLSTLTFSGCKRDPIPKGALKKQKFEEVLLDVHLAEAISNNRRQYKMDSLQSDALYRAVLEKHGVTEEQMKTTILYYSRHPKEYDKIYSDVLSKISMMTEEREAKDQKDGKELKEENPKQKKPRKLIVK
jgi:hypothetical protein